MHTTPDKWHQVHSILVVDDDPNWCFLAERIIRKAGFGDEILFARNGQEAVQVLKGTPAQPGKCPNLIFLDIKMPVMDGFAFLEAVTQTPDLDLSQTRIFMCSSSMNPQDKEKAHNYPIAGFVTKPLSKEILEEIL